MRNERREREGEKREREREGEGKEGERVEEGEREKTLKKQNEKYADRQTNICSENHITEANLMKVRLVQVLKQVLNILFFFFFIF